MNSKISKDIAIAIKCSLYIEEPAASMMRCIIHINDRS